MKEQYLIVIHCLIVRITYDVWPQARGCNRVVLETRYTVLPSSIDSYGVLCQRKERVSPSVAKLTTCDVTKRLLEIKKKSLERVVQRKILCESRGYHEGDCEYCCLLGSGAVWSNRRVLTFQKNLLHPCFCTLVLRAVSSSEVAMLWPRVNGFTSQKTVICFW